MNFKLFCNEQQKDGFKLSFDCQTKEEINMCEKLAQEVIKKITKIEVIVKQEDYE